MPTLNLTDETFRRLEAKAVGFDTPDSVIQRLLDAVDGKPSSKPELFFEPNSEDEFKQKLIKNKVAEITLHKTDGSREIIHWNANKFRQQSNLRANLWSGYLRGWKEKSIIRAELAILPIGNCDPEDDTEKTKILALELGLKYLEMEEIVDKYELHENESKDGLLYNYSIEFSDNCPKEILAKIRGLNGNCVDLDPNIFNEPEHTDI